MKIAAFSQLVVLLFALGAAGQDTPAPAEEDPQVWVGRLASPDTRDTARDKLRDLGPAAVPLLMKALKEAEPVIRSEAAFVLGRIAQKSAVPALIEALGDADARVRTNAAYALGELADAKSMPALVKALSDADAGVRANACFALGHVGDPKAAPEVVKALADPDENVRNFAASSLGTMKDARVLPALEWAALKDPSSGVRALAAASMGTLGDKRAAGTLVGLLDDKEYVVRARVIEALVALANDRKGYEARETETQRAAAVVRWKGWLARQKAKPVEPREPMDVYETWGGKPKPAPTPEPGPDTPDVDLIPAPPTDAPPGDLDEPERLLRQKLAADPESASRRFELAELLFMKGKIVEPMRLYASLDPMKTLPEGIDRARLKLRLGTCLRRLGDKDRAKEMLNDAAAADARLSREAARQFAAMKDFRRALEILERDYNLNAGNAEGAWALASFLLKVPEDAVRDAKKAAAYAEVAWSAKPDDPRYVATMAEAKWAVGEKEKAVSVLEEALKKTESAPLRKQLEEYKKTLVPAGEKAENETGAGNRGVAGKDDAPR